MMRYSLDMICTIDEAGRFIQVSESCRQILGYNPQELQGHVAHDFIPPKDRRTILEFSQIVSRGNTDYSFENCYIKKNGQEIPLYWSVVWSAEENFFFCIVREATAQKVENNEIQKSAELHRVLVEQESDMLALLDVFSNYLYVAGASLKNLGYHPNQLIGVNLFELIHPEDIDKVQEAVAFTRRSQALVKLTEYRYKTADGQWQWQEATLSNQLENPAIKAIVVSCQDITVRKHSQLQLTRSEQRFRSLFANNPDMVLYQDEAGTIMDANPSFIAFIKKQKIEVTSRLLYAFLPEKAALLFKEKLKEAFNGSKVNFEVDVNFREQGHKVLSVVKIPLVVEDKVVAVHAIIKDITLETQAQRIIEQQANRLNTILESITDAFFTLDKNWNFTFINHEFERLLQMDRQKLIGENIWASFPTEITQKLYNQYQHAAQTGETIHFDIYLETFKSWYDIKVYSSEEGLSVYFQDVTERINAEKELERLSLIARKTTNGVVITDAQGLTEWVNEGFTNMTGYSLAEIAGKKPGAILQGPDTDPVTVERISAKLKAGQPFTIEILNYKKTGEKFWINKEITPILNQAGDIFKFIAVQNDITEKKQAELELKKLSLVASRTSHGVVIMDTECHIEWVNEGFTRMFGYTLSEVIGKDPKEFLEGPNTDKAEVQQMREKLTEAVPFNVILMVYRKNGESFWVSIDFSPVFDKDGILTQFIAIQKDITLRKEAEANLVKMSQDLYKHNRDLQQFTYIISHNLRSPVANAIGLTRLLTSLSKESKDFDTSLVYLKDTVIQMDQVLKDINQILSIRDRKNVQEKKGISLFTICHQALIDLTKPLRQCNAQVQVDINKETEVQAYRAYLYSIFHNLLTNAIKYRSEKRALQIIIKATRVPDGRTCITFSDNGSGFDRIKVGDNAFKLYKRFHPQIEGKGIGLFLVKTHVEAMNGQIEVSSQVDVGTSFTIYLS